MARIPVTRTISIDPDWIEESFTRSGGAGGQHVNTTDSAVLLRFDVARSDLPERVKIRLAELAGTRMTHGGVLTLRSEGSRSQHVNRADVRERLLALIREATIVQAKRRPTKPTRASQTRRVDAKKGRSAVKSGRRKPAFD
ncbi:alternative ribosome rescue aminoacyl-tRNA hydrolase ArfB [Sphingomonas endophytica]|uniref:Peptide chain release factor I n=1 Tax=Sphingomonas endophytica TaxID=869719 RepID=A0A147I722_9SPHN|nr:alternative ribosome rescue aminoacyl-tRNA hydrolase ArfB [Sphingomonas endophytica]KTT74758.1 peptide chain release factor I [Sphingomonas endophytica]